MSSAVPPVIRRKPAYIGLTSLPARVTGHLGNIFKKGPSNTATPMSNTIRTTAEALIESARTNFGQGCNLLPIELDKFRHLNLDGYRRFRASIEKRQFRWLGDLEFSQLSQAPDSLVAPTAISCFVCPEAVMVCFMYQTGPNKANVIRQWFKGVKSLRWIAATKMALRAWTVRDHYEFSTEFDDGVWIITSLDSPARLIDRPPKFEQEFLPPDTSPTNLLRHHRERVRSRIRDGSAQPVRAWSVGDVIESAKRSHDQKWKYRLQQGFYSKSELLALTDGQIDQAQAIYAEIRTIMLEDPELARFVVSSRGPEPVYVSETSAPALKSEERTPEEEPA